MFNIINAINTIASKIGLSSGGVNKDNALDLLNADIVASLAQLNAIDTAIGGTGSYTTVVEVLQDISTKITGGGESPITVQSGQYTPIVTTGNNVDSVNVQPATYLRVNNVVTVAGVLSVIYDGPGDASRFQLSLPVSSGFTLDGQLAGTMNANGSIQLPIRIIANLSNFSADFNLDSITGDESDISYIFQYVIGPEVPPVTNYRYLKASGGNNSNDGESLGQAWATMAFALAQLEPGYTLWLDDGTYTGDSNMLRPDLISGGLNGTSGLPITIKAINPGMAIIDGQGARAPSAFNNECSYLLIEDIDIGNAHEVSFFGGDVIICGPGSHDITFRRVVGYNADETKNSDVLATDRGRNILFEDCAAFGTGRKMFQPFQSSNITYRRCFGQYFNGSPAAGPLITATVYSSYNVQYENCIGNWDSNTVTPGSMYGIWGAIQMTGASDPALAAMGIGDGTIFSNSVYRGCIAIKRMTDGGYWEEGGFFHGGGIDGLTYDNVAVHVVTSDPTASPCFELLSLIVIPEFGNAIPAVHHQATNITAIHSQAFYQKEIGLDADWTKFNILEALNVGVAYPGGQSLYDNDGSHGATIKFRYQNGVLTNNLLFPWTMNQRIIDAMTREGYTPFNVNTTMQGIWGSFPVS